MKDFGELKLLLQFEVDACYPVESNDAKCKDRLRELEKVPSTKLDGKIKVVLKGAYIPQSSIVELKTKKSGGSLKWRHVFAQLFSSETPHLYVGHYKKKGEFTAIKHHTLDDLATTKSAYQVAFDQLHLLLQQIKDLAIKCGKDDRLSLVCTHESQDLLIYERKPQTSLLPERWVRRLRVEDDSKHDR